MSFWSTAFGFFWRTDESFAVLVMALALAALLFHFRREDRRSLFDTLLFFAACLLGQFVSGLIHAMEFAHTAEVLREVFVIGSGIALIRLWGLALFRLILPLFRFSPPSITEDIVVIVAYVVWGMIRLRYAGVDLGGIVVTSAVITAVLAFAMQDTLGNILGGLALQIDNSVGIGDWIKVDDVAGRVVDIRWRSTLVETRNWETVVIPNSQLMKNKFLVLGRRTGQPVQWRRWVWFEVGLDVPPPKAAGLAEEAVRQSGIDHVAKEPAPNCVLMEIGTTGSARYALRYWLTDLAEDDPTDAAVRWHVMAALRRADIKLSMEERGVFVTRENEKYEEAVHRREIQLRIRMLKQVELFSQMTEEELAALAERLRFSPFARGEIISRQGATAHWLYIFIGGEAEVYVDAPDGSRRIIRTLGKGHFFGEMGLMTGAPRTASVVAKTDVECYRLDKELFEEILRRRPAIAEEMSQVLAVRKAEQDRLLLGMSGENGAAREAPQRSGEILATIKRFFGLGG